MLQIQHICKEYRTEKLVQKALDDMSLNLRDNEFVAILGPSGSGKTTLLNVIGGLDRYDSGDIIINGISTKQYKDRDWDSYRNHTIGFVFQSYNLIPHQTVLANVELALTISGVSRSERKKKAIEALEKVGLGAQIHKKPSQMSGGQMQRVAIARALVNNPDILLADEPTGALDSDTSVQVMELLKEVAKERLVVMVTHNPELAELYATRIVNVKDGKIISDTDPFEERDTEESKPVHKNMGKSSMSVFTALSLSFQNLRTKKARTFLTSFAGSIGIIGIALILAISNGVNGYIQSMEEETLSEYPLQIQSSGIDITSMMMGMAAESKEDGKKGSVGVTEMLTSLFSKTNSNDLESLKKYLDDNEKNIKSYASAVEYKYSVIPQIFRLDGEQVRQVNPEKSFTMMGIGTSSLSSMMSGSMNADMFYELPSDKNLYQGQYDLKAGKWPENYQECVLILNSQGNINDLLQYTLGLRDGNELDKMVEQFVAEETVVMPELDETYSYDKILGTAFKLVNSADYYEYDKEYGLWRDKSKNDAYLKKIVKDGENLKIVGIVQPMDGATATMLRSGIGYTSDLIRHIMQQAANSKIVQEQLAATDTNIFTGEIFGKEDPEKQLDMESLFKINTDAIREAFQIDESAFQFDMSQLADLGSGINMPDLSEGMDMAASMPDFSKLFDLKDLDFSNMPDAKEIEKNLPDTGNVDMKEILKQINISVSQEDVEQLFSGILQGYLESIKDKPEADFSKLQDGIMQYLTSEEVTQKLRADIEELVRNNIKVSLPQERLLAEATQLMNQYLEYAKENNIKETNVQSILAFLSMPEIQQQIIQTAEEIIKESITVTITEEQLKSILEKDVWSGYPEYAKKHSLPDPANFGQYFIEYITSEDGQKKLQSGLMKIWNSSNMDQQLSDAMKSYMGIISESYMTAISEMLQENLTKVMDQMQEKLAANMQKAVKQMMGSISSNMQGAIQNVMTQVTSGITMAMSQSMNQLGSNMQNALSIDPDAFAKAIQMNMDSDELSELMMSLMSYENATLDGNLKKLGYAKEEVPSEIDIYPKDFESKDKIVEILDDYNSKMQLEGKDEQVINYTDMVGTLMSSVTEIVDVISYVLIAFVAISLVVSSIMIGVITYISVLERRKEIGILRAIGASKGNISTVFNAEAGIIGMGAGLLGIGISLILLIPGNILIRSLAGVSNIHATLPLLPALTLILLSVVLTLIGGVIPSRTAANSDPVTALRNE